MTPHKQTKAITSELLENLQTQAHTCRHTIVDVLTKVQSSHLGCSFSIVDILVVLYHTIIDVELIKKQSPARDYFILSKGHSASALYATLASVGLIDHHELITTYYNGYLAGHPTRTPCKGIEASTGSLGQGLSMGVGLALAAINDQRPNHIYVLVGDGECQEGAVWEALSMASRFKLSNLTIIVDYNNLQGYDKTDDIAPMPLDKRFEAFGCTVQTVDGHDYQALIRAFTSNQQHAGPTAVIARTTKGKGLSFIENKLEWHYRSLKPEQYEVAKKELG